MLYVGRKTALLVSLAICVAGGVSGAQTPDTVSDLVLWLDASDVNGDGSQPSDGATIGTWTDKSGLGNDATEPLLASQPTFRHQTYGCKPGLYFDRLATGLSGDIVRPNAQEFTVFIVAEVGAANSTTRNAIMEISSAGGSGPRSIFFVPQIHPTALTSPLNFDTLQVLRWTETAPNGNFSLYETGVANTVNASKSWGVVGDTNVSYFIADDRTGGDDLEESYINEILIYDRILTAQEITDIESYLSAKWLGLSPCDPVDLQVSKSVNSSSPGGYALPSEDLVYTFEISNIGGADMDDGSIFLVDVVPDALEMFTGDFDPVNVGMGPISFSDGGTGLAFSASADFGVSFGVARPASMTSCSDTPNGTYDDRVRYLCLSPTGTVAPGSPAPVASLQFRARIK